MLKEILRTEVKKATKKLFGKEVNFAVERDERFADYSSNVALVAGEGSRENAEKIKAELEKSKIFNGLVLRTEIAGPGFLNFWIKQEAVQKQFIGIYKNKKTFGKPGKRPNKTIVLDYSGPNIAKPMGIGHLRSTIIGQALYNVLKFSGYKVVGDNHLGDWGKQFGVLIAAYKKSNLQKKKKLEINDLLELYVGYTRDMKENSALDELAKLETKKLQQDDKENTKIWKLFYKISLNEYKTVYKRLGVKIDCQHGESFYQPMLESIVKEAQKKNIAKESEGAMVIPMENQTPFLLKKSDGAYLYGTTDLATIKFRVKKFKPSEILYVVANEQAFHFEQLFKASAVMGLTKKEKLEHVKFGMMLASDMKKFSTREGKTISLVDVLDEAVVRAQKIIEEKNSKLSKAEKGKIAEAVGVGAVIYNDLSQNRMSDIAFDWEKILSMEGNAAPYLQYTYTRLKGILKKARPSKFDANFLKEEREKKLIILIEEFPYVLEKVSSLYYPHYLADYLYSLSKEANAFYQSSPVLNADRGVREARLALIDLIAENIKAGLNLLGVKTVERM